jgi:hypothetical protein
MIAGFGGEVNSTACQGVGVQVKCEREAQGGRCHEGTDVETCVPRETSVLM